MQKIYEKKDKLDCLFWSQQYILKLVFRTLWWRFTINLQKIYCFRSSLEIISRGVFHKKKNLNSKFCQRCSIIWNLENLAIDHRDTKKRCLAANVTTTAPWFHFAFNCIGEFIVWLNHFHSIPTVTWKFGYERNWNLKRMFNEKVPRPGHTTDCFESQCGCIWKLLSEARRMPSNNVPAMPGISNSNFWKGEAPLVPRRMYFQGGIFYYGDSNVNVYSLMEWNWSENKLFQRSAPLPSDTQTWDMYNFIYFHFASLVWRVWQIDTYTEAGVWVSSNGIGGCSNIDFWAFYLL